MCKISKSFIKPYCDGYAKSFCSIFVNDNSSGFTNPPPVPCFSLRVLVLSLLGWRWSRGFHVRIFAASAGPNNSFVSMEMYFSFNLVPKLVMLAPSHVTTKQLDLLYSESDSNIDIQTCAFWRNRTCCFKVQARTVSMQTNYLQ